jgi:2'-hydroxyisoflavone reductase
MIKKKVLILGGTQFIGRNLVIELLKNQDLELTLFNRQITGQGLFPDVKKIKGDRQTLDINQIKETDWDYVIDVSCYFPNDLSAVLANLSPAVRKYIYVSTCSVYDSDGISKLPIDEESRILGCTKEQSTDLSNNSYGNRKAECERILKTSGFKYSILRPALVYGPYDHTDRLYYWLYQVWKQGDILIPDNGQRIFSLTYVQDLVILIASMLDNKSPAETYNAISHIRVSIAEIINVASKLIRATPKLINAEPKFLHAENISEWWDMPLWQDSDSYIYNNKKMMENKSIKPKSLEQQMNDTIDYYGILNWPVPKYGIQEKKRNALLSMLT